MVRVLWLKQFLYLEKPADFRHKSLERERVHADPTLDQSKAFNPLMPTSSVKGSELNRNAGLIKSEISCEHTVNST